MPDRRYTLHPACRVRQERFGLLFYDLRGPRLLFAETGDALTPAFFAGTSGTRELLSGVDAPRRERLAGFLETLVQKGFVREQPVC